MKRSEWGRMRAQRGNGQAEERIDWEQELQLYVSVSATIKNTCS